MSDLPPPPPAPPPPPPGPSCHNCGFPVSADQDWCLKCGAALTTQVAGAGGWRTPLAIAAAVLLVAGAVLVFAFMELSGEADRVANAPVTGPTGIVTPTPTPGPSGPSGLTGPSGVTGPTGSDDPTATRTPSTTTIGKWPAGETAYTVILFSETSRESAQSKARTVSSLPGVGILESSDYSSLAPGYFVVFSDQYDTLDAAQRAAKSAGSQAPGAYAKEVVPK